MDSTLFLATVVAVALGLCTLLGYWNFKLHQESKRTASSSSSSLSPSSSPTSLSQNLRYQAFPSFHGPDVRISFLSHLRKEFRRKAIDIFMDSDIMKSKSIGRELYEAIKRSRIAVVILSRNYASSSWCLNELVEIIKCREDLDQVVMVLFYGVDPTDVRKQTGDFGKAFEKTCKGKTKEEIDRWRFALTNVSNIFGYHSKHWEDEAAMIETITTDISNKLGNSSPSSDFDGLVGMEDRMEKLEPLLRLDLDDVRIIGIWGPSRIGKTTFARYLYSKLSHGFDLKVFMKDIKGYKRPSCSDEYALKLDLQQELLSQMFDQKDIEIRHLGVVQDRLKDKRVFVVLDDVDGSVQIDALAKKKQWFGPGSRIIITTQDIKLLKAHGINYIHKVYFPTKEEAFQIFCMNAFGQKSAKDGFEELAWDAMYLYGIDPPSIRTIGIFFRGMSKQDWTKEMSQPKWEDALIELRINPDSQNPMRNSRTGVKIRNIKHKAFSRSLSVVKKTQMTLEVEADSDNLMWNSPVGIRIRKTNKVLSRMLSTLKKKQIAACEAEAARIYERRKKDVDESINVEYPHSRDD